MENNSPHFEPHQPGHGAGAGVFRSPGWMVVIGWVVFFVLWTLFILGWGQGEVLLFGAAHSAFFATLSAALLSPFVWRLTGRITTNHNPGVGFVLLHLAVTSVFSLIWAVLAPAFSMLSDGENPFSMEWEVHVTSWRLFMGVWLYFIITGISYAARISVRLQEQRQIAARAEALAAEAHLAAMRSQLHPHFLFNALHSVSTLIETEPDQAMDAMEKLGDLLRYAIRDREGHFTSVGDEWNFVSDYVDLQRLRFRDQITVHMELDPTIEQHQVPPFVLQPLVENAFIHGVGALPEGGSIWITALQKDQKLVLTVEDDGAGMSVLPESARRESLLGDHKTTGSGLKNLELRLRSIYGSNAHLSIEKRATGGTIVTIRCPLQTP